MTVAILPLGAAGSEAAGYAEELCNGLRELPPVSAHLATDAQHGPALEPDGADITHVVAPDAAALVQWLPDRTSPAVATVLHSATGLRRQPGANSGARALPVVVTLTREDAAALCQAGLCVTDAMVVPCWVPDRCRVGQAPTRAPSPAFVLYLASDGEGAALAEALIACLPSLPVSVGLVVAFEAGASKGAALAARLQAMAQAQGAGSRLATAPIQDEAALAALLNACSAVVAPADLVSGVWHGLSALGYGRPLLAPDLPVFRDVMVRAGCVRLLRPDEPGHVCACLRALLSNPIGMAEMGDRATSYARAHTRRSVAERMAEVYLGAKANGI